MRSCSKNPGPFLAVLILAFFLALTGALLPAGIQAAAAAGEEFTWTDTGGEVGDFAVSSLAWDGTGLYAGTIGHGVWRFDPTAGTWTDTGGEVASQSVRSLAWSGSHLYASTGSIGGVWRYDPASSTWENIGIANTPIMCLAWSGSALYAGGRGVWRYDPSTGAWTNTGGIPNSDFYATLSLAWSGSALYAGGMISTGSNIGGTGVCRYDPATGAWTDISGDIAGKIISSLAWGGSSLYAGCWSYRKPLAYYYGVWRYSPASGAWTDTQGPVANSLIPSLGWNGSGLFAGVVTIGSSGTNPSCSVWYYDPTSGTWTGTGWQVPGVLTAPTSLTWDGSGRLYMGTGDISATQPAGGDGVWYCEVAFPPPTLTSVTPDRAPQFTVWQDVAVEGMAFRYGAKVRLEKDGKTVSEAFNVNVVSDTHINCTLGLFGLAPGPYDLVVENPDGKQAVMEEGFTVTSICGAGSGTALLALGLALGLLSTTSLGLRRRRRKHRPPSH